MSNLDHVLGKHRNLTYSLNQCRVLYFQFCDIENFGNFFPNFSKISQSYTRKNHFFPIFWSKKRQNLLEFFL